MAKFFHLVIYLAFFSYCESLQISSLDFAASLLKGLDLTISREKIQKCAYNLKDPTKTIESAFTHFKAGINWERAMDIYEGILSLIDVAREVFVQLNPCFSDNKEFIETKEELEDIDFNNTFETMIENGQVVFEYVKRFLINWGSGNVKVFGEDMGKIIVLITKKEPN